MPDFLSPLQRVQQMFGVGGDGASFQTKRALQAEGEGDPTPPPAPVAPIEPAYQGQGGGNVDAATLQRIQAVKQAESQRRLQQILEQRQKLIQGLPQ